MSDSKEKQKYTNPEEFRERKSGDELGDLLAPAAQGSGLDDEFAEIMASVGEDTVDLTDDIDARYGDSGAAPAAAGEALDVADDGLVDADGVLQIDLPDEPPVEVPETAETEPAPAGEEAAAGAAETATTLEETPSPGPDGESEGSDTPTVGRRRRRRRDPFRDMGPVSSSAASMGPRDLLSLSELKQIKRARVRHEGHRVVTDDVKKLKSLSIQPHLPPGEYLNYYVEPVRIEYYIPKESRFAVETRYLYIPLVDPEPRSDLDDRILKPHMEQNRFVDLIDLMNEHPVYITDILESYNTTMGLYESLSRAIMEADEGDNEAYRRAFYLCEVLSEYEPTIAALNFLGEFMSWNLNWLIRAMNVLGMEFAASDKTISYLIKRRNIYWEENGLDYDERFEILAALFYEQAFPNRGLEEIEEDYFYDIFDKKFEV